MSVVTIFSGSRCHGDEVVRAVADELGYTWIGDEALVAEASTGFGVSADSLRRAMHAPPSFFNNLTHERERCIALLKVALAERLAQDDCVYHGFAVHLVPSSIAHVLRVCLIANPDHRVRQAMESEGVSESKAARLVEKEDQERYGWVYDLTKKKPWDARLYDMVVPMHDRSVEEAAKAICENARSPALRPTEASRQAMEDFVLAARVNKALVEKGFRYDVAATKGRIRVTLRKEVLMMSRLKKKLQATSQEVPGVEEVEVHVDTSAQMQTPFGPLEAEPPIKVLLVDDEKEFVETLSGRLRMREVQPSIAYNGEEALAAVEKDEPEVMILDLKMPGIDGLEVLRRLKRERPAVEVIILTGHGSEQDKRLAEQLGAFAYLEKPVDINILTDVMKRAYRKAQESKSAGTNDS